MDAQGVQPGTYTLDWRVREVRADGSIVLEASGDVALTLQSLQALALESAYVILRTDRQSFGFVRVHKFDTARHPENTLRLEEGAPVITLGSVPVETGQHVTHPADAFHVKVGHLFTLADGRFQRGEAAEK